MDMTKLSLFAILQKRLKRAIMQLFVVYLSKQKWGIMIGNLDKVEIIVGLHLYQTTLIADSMITSQLTKILSVFFKLENLQESAVSPTPEHN
jgi:hypothetical protein